MQSVMRFLDDVSPNKSRARLTDLKTRGRYFFDNRRVRAIHVSIAKTVLSVDRARLVSVRSRNFPHNFYNHKVRSKRGCE